MNKQIKTIDQVVPLSLPVEAGFFGSMVGYAGKQLQVPKGRPLTIGQMEAIRRSLAVIQAILKDELEVEGNI